MPQDNAAKAAALIELGREVFGAGRSQTVRDEVYKNRDELGKNFHSFNQSVAGHLESFTQQLTALTQMNEQKLEKVRDVVENRLRTLQEDNSQKLEHDHIRSKESGKSRVCVIISCMYLDSVVGNTAVSKTAIESSNLSPGANKII